MAIIKIEEYENGHIWYGNNGSISRSGYCATTDDSTKYGNLIEIIEGEPECSFYLFTKNWNEQKEITQEFMLLMLPELKDRINSRNVLNLKSVNDLLKIAYGRAAKMGYTRTCPRCGGTGNYSYNHRDGTKCFKCNGNKVIVKPITKKLLHEIKQELNSKQHAN